MCWDNAQQHKCWERNQHHEEVRAEYISTNVWGMKQTQIIAVDNVGETFQKRHYDECLGWHEQRISREDICEELVTRLSRPCSLATNQRHAASVDEPDIFAVKDLQELQHETQSR